MKRTVGEIRQTVNLKRRRRRHHVSRFFSAPGAPQGASSYLSALLGKLLSFIEEAMMRQRLRGYTVQGRMDREWVLQRADHLRI